jgi:hypothetical protein
MLTIHHIHQSIAHVVVIKLHGSRRVYPHYMKRSMHFWQQNSMQPTFCHALKHACDEFMVVSFIRLASAPLRQYTDVCFQLEFFDDFIEYSDC